jgi:hypothetical protein
MPFARLEFHFKALQCRKKIIDETVFQDLPLINNEFKTRVILAMSNTPRLLVEFSKIRAARVIPFDKRQVHLVH